MRRWTWPQAVERPEAAERPEGSRPRGAVFAAVSVTAAVLLTERVLKPLIDRTAQGHLEFPSGHATATFALAAVCAVLLAAPPRLRLPGAFRLCLALAAILIAGAVATAVIALGYHYFTDTVGGAAVGTAVVLATAFIVDRFSPGGRELGAAGHKVGADGHEPGADGYEPRLLNRSAVSVPPISAASSSGGHLTASPLPAADADPRNMEARTRRGSRSIRERPARISRHGTHPHSGDRTSPSR